MKTTYNTVKECPQGWVIDCFKTLLQVPLEKRKVTTARKTASVTEEK